MERRHAYGWAIAATGLVLAAIQLVQGVQQLDELTGISQSDQVIVFAFETFPFALIGMSLFYVGYWLTDQRAFDPDLPLIVGWGIGSTVLFASLGALVLFSQQVSLNTLEQGRYLATNLITVGAVVGVLVGVYDAQGRARERELASERDRVEAFAGKAADINNYGRELHRAGSVEEVSALCIEALQALVDLTESAFVVVEDGQAEVVNSTVVDSDEAGIETAAIDALEGNEPATAGSAVESESLEGRPGTLLVVPVRSHSEGGVVLLAPVADPGVVGEEDRQLLGLLVSHAEAALGGLRAERAV
ncbi:MAG: hypothetical protein ACOCPZ_03050 [Natrialbaceae archaeon]